MFNTLRARLAHFDLHLLLTLALCLFTLWPLAYRPGLPNGTDVLYHVYRVAEMDRLWAHGVLIPSWAESFYTGYGAPLFHYYASLSYYLTSTFARVFGTDPVNSLRLLIAVCMLAGAAGMYLFMQPRAGKLGGVLAALSFTYSPYILFTEPYARGAYPEMTALALTPLILWRYQRLMQTGSARAFLLAALSSGALILTHNLMALVMTGLLGGWLVWEWVLKVHSSQYTVHREEAASEQRTASSQTQGSFEVAPLDASIDHPLARLTTFLPFLALLTGLLLTAYFWLPITQEGGAVRLGNLTNDAGVPELDYRNFFVPLGDLLAASPRPDAGAVNGLEHRLNLGVMQWLLALGGVVVCGWRLVATSNQRSASSKKLSAVRYQPSASPHSLTTSHPLLSTLYFALAGLACIFLMLPQAEGVWTLVRPFALLQFPWRLLGPAAVCLAVVGGMVGRVFSTQYTVHSSQRSQGQSTEYKVQSNETGKAVQPIMHRRSLLLCTLYSVVCTLIVVTAAPTLYADEWEHEAVDTSVAGYHAAELAGRQRATTFTNEYLPATVLAEPGATPRLLADYADGYPVNKAHVETLPPDAEVTLIDHGPQHDEWVVNTAQPFQMEVLTYYFPGWAATVNGVTVPITPSEPHGLITLPVPAGESRVRLELGSTPPRDLGRLVSLVGVVVLVASGWWLVAGEKTVQRAEYRVQSEELQSAEKLPSALIASLLLSAVLLALLMRPGGSWIESPPGEAWSAQQPVSYQLGDNLALLGYDLNATQFRPGDRLRLNLYWWASAPVPYGYAVFVHVTQGGPPVAQADKLNPAGRPTVNWTPEQGFIKDDYAITLPESLGPGTYQISVGLYTCDTRPAGECGNGERPSVRDAAGNLIGDAVPLVQIVVSG
ncbi:MAG: glycosyltransferase family 39 protein [Anaerolineae bacterium]|nr:glycosyltransferase family 39 protein [Anaerolineae bacterium]